jgi:hypothetical protein
MLRDFFDRGAAAACKKSLCPAKNGSLFFQTQPVNHFLA